MEKAITANRVIDSLMIPGESLKAMCFLHQDVEQKLFNTRRVMDQVDNEMALRECIEHCLDEVDSYVFVIGQLIYEVRDAVLELNGAAKEETDAAFKKREQLRKAVNI